MVVTTRCGSLRDGEEGGGGGGAEETKRWGYGRAVLLLLFVCQW